MTDQFVNPITLSFSLLEGYKDLLRETLQIHRLGESDIESVLKTIQVDRGLFFSINPKYKSSNTSFAQFCRDVNLSPFLATDSFPGMERLYMHQEKAIRAILNGSHTVVSTGTGSGKTESFLVPIIDHCLKHPGPGVKALIIYPMNALANDQLRRLARALSGTSLKFGTFIGSTPESVGKEIVEPISPNHLVYREEIRANPPDILITNYVMLDWMLTRPGDLAIFRNSSRSLRYVVLDEIHTYRGNKATHLKYLLARLKANLDQGPLYIGTSATLRRNRSETTDQTDQIDSFIKPLLDTDHYALVEPEYEPEAELSPISIPSKVFDTQDQLDWFMSPDPVQGLQAIGLLTGKTYSSMHRTDEGMRSIIQDLSQNEFIVKLRKTLIEKNAQSFTDLVSLFSSLVPLDKEAHNPERIVKAYLSAVSFLNHLAPSDPILDYRLHLFVRNIGGHLKMCIKCHRYHSGAQDYCQDCGFPLFIVYKRDIRKCIGKVSGNRLKWSLLPESDDRKNSYYVLVEILEEARGGDMGFDHTAPILAEEILLNYDPYGKLRLTFLKGINSEKILEEAIQLVDVKDDHEYLYQFVKSLLKNLPRNEKKILGFVDNREKAAQYGLVLRHEFASDFFEAFLKLNYLAGRQLNLVDTWTYLQDQIPEEDDRKEIETELFEDLELWYRLFIMTPVRGYRALTDRLALKSPDEFDEAERQILDVFLRERAIDLPIPAKRTGKYIRFRMYYARQRKGIHTTSANASNLREYPSISLSPDAVEYQEIVQKYNGTENEGVQDIINRLIAREVLIEGQTADEKTHYYLSPCYIAFNLAPSIYDTYRDLRDDLLLTAAVHSSEIADTERREVEKRFIDGAINFIMATPTLEMGIDIGDLEVVVMVGAPPLPSNYAQRAGRAGRKRDSHFALILAFCFETSNHDNYYFQDPKQMIDGEISPPSFDPHNVQVLAKHFNTCLFTGRKLTGNELARFTRDDFDWTKLTAIARILGIDNTVGQNLLDQFREQVQWRMSELTSGHVLSRLYSIGLFPDYAFRHDQVYAVPEGTKLSVTEEKRVVQQSIEELSLASREPEMAYYKLVPGEEMFMAGDVYTILPAGQYTEFKSGENQHVRAYSYIEASKKDGSASRTKIQKKYELVQKFEAPNDFQVLEGILGISYHPECNLLFLNKGKKEPEKTNKFSDEDCEFAIGYQLQRQALILRFDRVICSEESYYLSLISALDRAIKDKYGLDEGELKTLIDVKPFHSMATDNQYVYVVLYDAMGNGNVRLQQMYSEFNDIVQDVYARLDTCLGMSGSGCKTGCYRCLKSYNLQQKAHKIQKEVALMFAGYLAGKNRFLPSLETIEPPLTHYDLEFQITLSGKNVTLQSRTRYSDEIKDSQNRTIFDLMIKAIQSEFHDGMKSLRVLAKQDYLVKAIELGEIKQDRDDFARLQFNLLRFQYVKAEKG